MYVEQHVFAQVEQINAEHFVRENRNRGRTATFGPLEKVFRM